MTTTLHAEAAARDATTAFRSLAADFFEQVYFRFAPTVGTQAGLHQYDPQLEDYSRAAIDRQIEALKTFEAKFDAVSDAGLDESTR
ncbi:MAG: DUF885 domain-containing protein, partial [Silvibacterium sp.]|nr:DUF885 domain-containing protein [Silvibacterium sp.]